jgi:DNA-binding response OmpR family regulator
LVHPAGGHRNGGDLKVLIVDDDRELTDLLQFAFQRAGFVPLIAHDSPSALRQLDQDHPDLLVVDVNLGAWNGFDLLQEVRRSAERIPIVMLTALGSEEDKVKGLELGADDYVTKPFSHRELIARVRAHLRRVGQDVPDQDSGPRTLQVGPIDLNVGEHSVKVDGRPVSLTVTEFRLLHALMREAGSVVSTRQLLKRVWGYDDPTGTDVVRVTVHRLRRKLQDDAGDPKLLHTIPGVGVMLKPGSLQTEASTAS